jgi:hypothetical protein
MSGNREKGADENKRPDDIRRFLSPSRTTTTPSRRRRIVTSSDSDTSSRPALFQGPIPASNGQADLHQHVAQHQNVVQLSSSDDDSMYIPLPRAAAAARPMPQEPTAQARSLHTPVHTPNRRTPRSNETPRRGTPQSNTARVGNRRPRPAPSRRDTFAGEAEEATTDEDSQVSDCAESDTHGADLYRQAMASCRNANAARTQLRAETTDCRVCAKFAAYLQHFL